MLQPLFIFLFTCAATMYLCRPNLPLVPSTLITARLLSSTVLDFFLFWFWFIMTDLAGFPLTRVEAVLLQHGWLQHPLVLPGFHSSLLDPNLLWFLCVVFYSVVGMIYYLYYSMIIGSTARKRILWRLECYVTGLHNMLYPNRALQNLMVQLREEGGALGRPLPAHDFNCLREGGIGNGYANLLADALVVYFHRSKTGKPECLPIAEGLYMPRNTLDSRGLKEICKALGDEKCAFHYLNLRGCQSIADEGSKSVARLLKDTKTFNDLNMEDCSVGTEGLEAISSALASNQTLRKLNLDKNAIKNSEVLSLALGQNQCLTSLSLVMTGLSDADIAKLSAGLCDGCSVKELDLSQNKITSEGVKALVPCLSLLLDLNISGNPIRDDGAEVLANAMVREGVTIRKMACFMCSISEKGARLLLEMVRINRNVVVLCTGAPLPRVLHWLFLGGGSEETRRSMQMELEVNQTQRHTHA